MKINRKKLYLFVILYAILFSCFVYHNIDNLTLWSTYKFYYDIGLTPYQVVKYDNKLFTCYVVGKETYMWFAYPPFAFYLLIFFASPYLIIKKLIGENIILEILLAKLHSLVGFILASLLLYYIVYKKTNNKSLAGKIEKIFLISPLMYFAFFQQALFDVWMLVFYALVFLALYEWKKPCLAGIFTACGILTKQYFIVFLPVISYTIYKNYNFKKLFEFFLFMSVFGFFIISPFVNSITELIRVCFLFHNNRPAQSVNIYMVLYIPLIIDKLFNLNIITLNFVVTVQKILFILLFPFTFFGLLVYMIKKQNKFNEKEFLYYSLLFLTVFYIFSKVVNPQHYPIGCYVLLLLYAFSYETKYLKIFKWFNILGCILYLINFPQAQMFVFYEDYLSIPIWREVASLLVKVGMLFDINWYTIVYLVGITIIVLPPLFNTYVELAKELFNKLYFSIYSSNLIKVSKIFFLSFFAFIFLISVSLPIIVKVVGKYKIKQFIKRINFTNSSSVNLINYNLNISLKNKNDNIEDKNLAKEILLTYYEMKFKDYELVASGKIYINNTII